MSGQKSNVTRSANNHYAFGDNNAKEKMHTQIELSDDYWDCECDENYIHKLGTGCCNKCKAIEDDQPPSIVKEVEWFECKKILNELENVPVINDEIDCEFMHFEKGTEVFEIWHWLESKFNLTLGDIT